MSAKSTDVRSRIEQYRRLCETGDPETVNGATREALGDRHYLLVARAAELCGERLIYELESSLVCAYARQLDKPVKKDPGCIAKGAIARALVALDAQDSDFYLAGMRYRQPEPVRGGTVDTAVDLRCTCAVGLVATPYPRALIELVTLLYDPEPHARAAAARAIACTEPLGAEAMLRAKVLEGDAEVEVIGDCLAGLLQIEPDETLGFVAALLNGYDPDIRELAALALGESRLDAAIDVLRQHWETQPLKRDSDRVLLRAAVLHRSEAAFDWLCSVVAEGDTVSARMVVQELAVYRANERLGERLRAVVRGRDDRSVQEAFARSWGIGEGDDAGH